MKFDEFHVILFGLPKSRLAWPVVFDEGEKEEIDIFKGIDEMREVMTKTQAQHGDIW
jgi:hypothetical protein